MDFGGNIPHLSELIRLFATLGTVAQQTLLFLGFCRQEYWSGLPCPPPGDPPDPRIEPVSLLSPALAGRPQGIPESLVGKESACNAVDPSSIPWLGKSLGEGKGYPLPYYGLENSMYYIVHGVTKDQTWLSDFHFSLPLVPPGKLFEWATLAHFLGIQEGWHLD